jgi:uncharacterized protein
MLVTVCLMINAKISPVIKERRRGHMMNPMKEEIKTEHRPRLVIHPDADAFLGLHQTILERDPVTNNLMLGLLERIKGRPFGEKELVWTVHLDDDTLVLMIAGLYVILYATTDRIEMVRKAVFELRQRNITYPGVIGVKETALMFKTCHERMTGQQMTLGMNQRIYRTETSVYKPVCGATLELAQEKDIPVLVPWMVEFIKVAGEHATPEQAKARLTEKVRDGKLHLLKIGTQTVSMAAWERPFKDIVTVSYVFTPSDLRKRGYASACVGMLTEKLLETYRIVTLYTDLSNPVSNSIYQKIGFRPVADSVVYLT